MQLTYFRYLLQDEMNQPQQCLFLSVDYKGSLANIPPAR